MRLQTRIKALERCVGNGRMVFLIHEGEREADCLARIGLTEKDQRIRDALFVTTGVPNLIFIIDEFTEDSEA